MTISQDAERRGMTTDAMGGPLMREWKNSLGPTLNAHAERAVVGVAQV